MDPVTRFCCGEEVEGWAVLSSFLPTSKTLSIQLIARRPWFFNFPYVVVPYNLHKQVFLSLIPRRPSHYTALSFTSKHSNTIPYLFLHILENLFPILNPRGHYEPSNNCSQCQELTTVKSKAGWVCWMSYSANNIIFAKVSAMIWVSVWNTTHVKEKGTRNMGNLKWVPLLIWHVSQSI